MAPLFHYVVFLNVSLWHQALQTEPHRRRAERRARGVAVAGQPSLHDLWTCLWCLNHIGEMASFSFSLLRHQQSIVSQSWNIHATNPHFKSWTECVMCNTPPISLFTTLFNTVLPLIMSPSQMQFAEGKKGQMVHTRGPGNEFKVWKLGP